MDISQLSQLPLTVLVIVGAYWVIQRINDEHVKQIIALTTGFLEKYELVVKRADEDRDDSRLRWLERDKLLITTLIENQRSLVENAKENHHLRTTLQPLVTWLQIERRHAAGGASQAGGDSDAAN